MSYQSNRLALSPIKYLRLDDASGSAAVDLSTNAIDGVYLNTPLLLRPSLVGPGGGNSVYFNKPDNQGVQISGISDPTELGSLMNGKTALTFEFWVDFDGESVATSASDGYLLIIHRDGGIVAFALQYYEDSGTPKIRYTFTSDGTDNAVFDSTYTFSGKSVIHFTFDFTNNLIGLYVNGSILVLGSQTYNSNTYVWGNPTRNDYFGRGYFPGNGQTGFYDEFAIYPSYFVQADALAVYNDGQYPQVDVNIPAIDGSVTFNAPSTIVGQYAEIPAIDGSVTFNAPFAFREPENVELLRNVYQLVLTGDADATTDLILPMTSLQARKRSGSPSYLSVVIPGGEDYINEINARSNGDIVINKGYELVDGTLQLEEIARVNFEDIRSDEGGSSDSVTLTGHKTITYVPKTRTLSNASYRSTTNGTRRFRTLVDSFLNPSDTAIIGFESIVVDNVSYTVSAVNEQMEIVEQAP